MSEEGGVWRTIGGRRVFIKDKQTLSDAMKESGKFDTSKKFIKFEYLPTDEVEAHDKYYEMADECYDKLTKEEREIIKEHYVGTEESYWMNEALRKYGYDNISTSVKGYVDVLDKACGTYTAKENMASTRFVSNDFLQNVYNTQGNDRYSSYEQMKSQIGSVISCPSFTSVSLDANGNGYFQNLAVEMKIDIPKGTKMYVPENISEKEAILGRNTKMILKDVKFKNSKIEGMEKEYGKIFLNYEVVEDE